LSAKARTLSLTGIMRMTDDEAHTRFQAIRWADNGGEPFCRRCECTAVYAFATRRIWKCKACNHQFSVTSGTIFSSRKLPIRDYLAAIAIFVNAVKGVSALQLGRDIDCQYKTAFVMAHKLRAVIGDSQTKGELSGEIEIDGAWSASANPWWSRGNAVAARSRPWSLRKATRCRSSAGMWRRAQSFMLVNPAGGIGCTPIMRCVGSTIP
jgi:transposase-like protein